MGTNNLTSRIDGERIPASDHNELVQALTIDVVPRNNSRVAADLAGQLGTSALRWLRGYVKEVFVGEASENTSITGLSDELLFKVGNAVVCKMNALGINWDSQTDASIPRAKVDGVIFPERGSTTITIIDDNAQIWTAPYPCLMVLSDIQFDDSITSFIDVLDLGGFSNTNKFEFRLWNQTFNNGDLDKAGTSYIMKQGQRLRIDAEDDFRVTINYFRIP